MRHELLLAMLMPIIFLMSSCSSGPSFASSAIQLPQNRGRFLLPHHHGIGAVAGAVAGAAMGHSIAAEKMHRADSRMLGGAMLGYGANYSRALRRASELEEKVSREELYDITHTHLEKKLTDYFTSIGGQVRVTDNSSSFWGAEIYSIRGEIIRRHSYHEKITLYFIMLPFVKKTSSVEVFMIIDGQYAAGIGSGSPAIEAFRDMEPQYSGNLNSYLKSLLQKVTREVAYELRYVSIKEE